VNTPTATETGITLSLPSNNDVKESRRKDILRQIYIEENESSQREPLSRDTTYALSLKYTHEMCTITILR
jgi:Lhr-like helicase